MRFHFDADLRSVLRRAARIYRSQQIMRFGTDEWPRYFESPYRSLNYFCGCIDGAPLGYRPPIIELRPALSAMQGHWE